MTQKPTLQGWLVWLMLSLFSLFQFFLQVSGNMLAGQMMQSFHVNAAGLGGLNSAFFYGYVLVQMPAGLLYDRFQCRRVCLTALAVCGLGIVGFALSTSVWGAIVARLFMGLGAGFAFVGMVFAAAEWFPSRLFAMVVGLGEFIAMAGAAAGQKAAPYLIVASGWRELMWLCAGMVILLMIAMFIWLKDRPDHHAQGAPIVKTIMKNFAAISRIPSVWLSGLFCCGMFGVVTGFAALWGVPFLQQVYQLSYLDATGNMSLILLGIAIGGPILGWTGGRYAKGPKPVLQVTGALALLLMLLITFGPGISLWLLWLSLFLLGFMASSYVLAFSIVERVTAPGIRGAGIGLCNMIALLGAIIFQPATGAIVTALSHQPDQTLVYQLGILVLPLVMLAALIGTLWMRSQRIDID